MKFVVNLINQILRGVVIGVANVIPGVSGGTMMVSMGIYDQLIHSITHIFKEFWTSVKTLLPYAIGMLLGIVALAGLLKNVLLKDFPLPTYACFIGLILGGLRPLLKNIEVKKINAAAVAAFILLFIGVVCLGVFGPEKGEKVVSDVYTPSFAMDVPHLLLLLVLGAIGSATMIIPGVSGSMVMMLLGVYEDIIGAVDALKTAAFSLNFSAMGTPLFVLLPFLVGVVLGIFGVAKLLEYLMKKVPTITYCGVLGMVLASPVAILIKNRAMFAGVSLPTVLISIAALVAGFLAALFLERWSAKNAEAALKAASEQAE